MSLNVQLLIAAGGMGERLGSGLPKALVPLAGLPLIIHTLERFRSGSYLKHAIITAPIPYLNDFSIAVEEVFPSEGIRIIPGGETRQLSVGKGLAELDRETELVIIHDAARPFPPLDAIEQVVEEASTCGAATLAIPSVDTIMRGDAEALLLETPDRSALWACQTPQVFRVDAIRDAHAQAQNLNREGTDDATLVHLNGGAVKLVTGSAQNFKITTPDDVRYAEFLLNEELV